MPDASPPPEDPRRSDHYQQPRISSILGGQESDDRRLAQMCGKLSDIIKKYNEAAETAYKSSPESTSVMLLTIMELWVACDIIATKTCPLLLDYSVVFLPGLLDPLVLPKKEQMDRLAKVENYLAYRASNARKEPPWENCGGHSFAAKYFEKYEEAKTLHDKIVKRATVEKERKLAELRATEQQYRSLMAEYNSLCMLHKRDVKDGKCLISGSKCLVRKKAQSLRVSPFEWPVPEDSVEAKIVFVDLVLPAPIRHWRDITLLILLDIFDRRTAPENQANRCRADRSGLFYPTDNPMIRNSVSVDHQIRFRFRLGNYRPKLHQWVEEGSERNWDVANIIINHRIKYCLYDTFYAAAIPRSFKLGVTPQCWYTPPTVPAPLRGWATSTLHTMNDVIACQADCPEAMGLDEFKAFGNLRGVVSLQWYNILSQLAMPTLNFNRPETFYLLLQAANEAGPRGGESEFREAHNVMQDQRFSHQLRRHLRVAVSRIKVKWEADVALATFVCLTTRLLSLSARLMHEGCLALLADIRSMCIKEARVLGKKIIQTGSEEDSRDLSYRVLSMALICYATFDVGPRHLPNVLASVPEASIMIESSMAISERSPLHTLSRISNVLFHRYISLSYESASLLKQAIVEGGSSCLDDAIRRIWPSHPSGVRWHPAESGRPHMIEASTVGDGAHDLRYNLLTGEIRVDDSPLANLPGSYTRHPTYTKLFKVHTIPVMPSKHPGMQFTTRFPYQGHEVSFGMQGGELNVLARREGAADYRLIPPSMLKGDLPRLLVTNYVHWLNMERNTIEFRPVSAAWKEIVEGVISDGYLLKFQGSLGDGRARLTTPSLRLLIDIKSPTFALVSDIFSPIESPTFLHLVLERDNGSTLSIDLPRLRMHFTLRAGETVITSNHPRGFVVDKDQSIGALWGLQNRLVLCSGSGESGQRTVMIPHGTVRPKAGYNGHAKTFVETSDDKQVLECHLYRINDRLGQLEDTGALASKLFLCHLHAVTTHCLPDRLTGRTGTEEALRILRSAAVRSFGRLNSDEISLLYQLAAISPSRKGAFNFVFSSKISPLARNDDFYPLASLIIDQAIRSEALLPERNSIAQLQGRMPPCYTAQADRAALRRAQRDILEDLFTVGPPEIPVPVPVAFGEHVSTDYQRNEVRAEIRELLESLEGTSGPPQTTRYVKELARSLNHLESPSRSGCFTLQTSTDNLKPIFVAYRDRCQHDVERAFSKIHRTLSQAPVAPAPVVGCPTLWPWVTPILLLEQLSKDRWKTLSRPWRECLVAYALSITNLQRAERLVKLATRQDDDLVQEILNVGHSNWDPMEYPESLLFEVESGVLIRPVQESIAAQMRAPWTDQNAVMQLNMGEGKSSVIIPIVAAALADGTRLVRIVVGKAQFKQMMHILTKKLSGLLGRRIYQLPFSREMELDSKSAKMIEKTCTECKDQGGILLMQPEHLLSFNLLGLEHIIARQPQVGRSLLEIQDAFDKGSRDIIDESDDNLSVRFELTYTMGSQSPLEFAPHRWVIIQNVLDLVQICAEEVAKEDPSAVEFAESSHSPKGGFPSIRILNDDGERLVDKVATRIRRDGIEGFRGTENLPRPLKVAIRKYMMRSELEEESVRKVEAHVPAHMLTTLLLLRGLFAHGILAFALRRRRWRVNYGLDDKHSPPTGMAVPYRAKDAPAPRSEFSHPDLRIILTCLSYYYSGLRDADLFRLLEHLTRSPEGLNDYAALVKSITGFPASYSQLKQVNPRDRDQCVQDIFPFLRHTKKAIDLYLSRILFREELRDFSHMLTSSGWDMAKTKPHVTTGFSGTNDSKYLLPLSITQLEVSGQEHTNALVLGHLLRPENSVREVGASELSAAGSASECFLQMVAQAEPSIRVILDVGAQTLELTNLEMARRWLDVDHSADAAIYVDDDDELTTITREGYMRPLLTSPYYTDLSSCLVFLDQAHTRGTDLQLPDDYRAAVLLGPGITKDVLVQGKLSYPPHYLTKNTRPCHVID